VSDASIDSIDISALPLELLLSPFWMRGAGGAEYGECMYRSMSTVVSDLRKDTGVIYAQ